jgi:hypothetical protein
MEKNISNIERHVRILRLLELIEGKQQAIERHIKRPEPNQIIIEQYKELKESYQAELAELLQPYGVAMVLSQAA